MDRKTWFRNAGGYQPVGAQETLEEGIAAGLLNAHDAYGMTALSLAVISKWKAGVSRLLEAGADPERIYFRTGEAALFMAVNEANEDMARLLAGAGANPDAQNHFGATPREIRPAWFSGLPTTPSSPPPWRLQNTEHLAEHYHPKFEIPERLEREALMAGVAVSLYVFGPVALARQDSFKVRITDRFDGPGGVEYAGTVETPLSETHLPADVEGLRFGPQHVATVYLKRRKS